MIDSLLFSQMRLQLLFQQSVNSKIFRDFQMNDIIKIVLNNSIITTQRRYFRLVLYIILKGLIISIILKQWSKKSIINNKLISSMRRKLKQSIIQPLINKKKRKKTKRQGQKGSFQLIGQVRRFIGKITSRREMEGQEEESTISVIRTRQSNLF